MRAESEFTLAPSVAFVSGLVLLLSLVGCDSNDGGSDGDERASLPPVIVDWSALGQPGRAKGHHLLLVTFDTLRADHVGCYGGRVPTPAIDALAACGLRVERATGGVPVTLPSHASMLTGLEPPEHGVRHNGTFRLAPEHTTLAEVLSDAGYATAAVVGAFVLDRRYGLAQGFESYDDRMESAGESAGRHFDERPATAVTDGAIQWLDRHFATDPAAPFFLWVHYFDPHLPHQAPREFHAGGRNGYEAEIAYADAQLARLLAHLDELGQRERTLIAFTSDHGEGLGEHGEETHSFFIYDTTMCVPWMLSNAALFPEPVVVRDRVAGAIDLLPTTLDLLGVAAPDGVTGQNILTTPADPERALYIETMATLLDLGWAPLHGLFRRDDKFILAPRPEYYDVRRDAGELHDRYAESPVAKQLEAELKERMKGWLTGDEVLETEQPLDRAQVERLANLGYVRARLGDQPVGVRDPKDGMALLNRARRAEHQSTLRGGKNLQAAIQEIRAVLQEDPTLAKAYYYANSIYKRAGQWEAAESALRRALELSPRIDGWINLAQYCLRRKDYAAFQTALAEAVKIDPKDGKIYITLGDFHAMRGDFQKALEVFEQALKLDPNRVGELAREKIAQARARLER